MNMTHLMIDVVDFAIVGPYTLRIIFDDGAERTINFAPTLSGHYYAPLRNLDFFNQVRLDPEIHTLVWPNGADFDPATLYNWDQGDGAELTQRATHWRKFGEDRAPADVEIRRRLVLDEIAASCNPIPA
jgi:hypothetical protein